jgi:hypothetical protein
MHPAIDHEPMAANLEIIRVRPDFRSPGEINEFQAFKR